MIGISEFQNIGISEKTMGKDYIIDFWQLDVYQRLRILRKVVILKVIPKLPKEEKFDLVDQIRRACKAAGAILAEGFSKRFQKKHWQKYLTDVVGECNEMIDHLLVIQDVYYDYCNKDSIGILIDEYRICIKQLLKLGGVWKNFHSDNN